MRTVWNFRSAGQLTFGPGAARKIGPQIARRKWSRVLIVTDRNLEAAGLVEPIRESLREARIVVATFDGGVAEPSIAVAEAAVGMARQFGPSAILGLGGGSNMDLAKVTATVVTHGETPSDYFGFDAIPGPVVPLICVPTTAGTGSEVSHAAVLTDERQRIKVSTLSNYLRPSLAVVDPELTYSCPQRVTADSGIDALTHAIEGYTATDYSAMRAPAGQEFAYDGAHPLGDLLAEKAIELIGRNLPKAVHEPGNLAARDEMALAATLAGLAFSNCGVALVHALEYPVGADVHCSHGAGNGLLLPHVMRFNLPERVEKFARVAALLGEDVKSLTPLQSAERAIAAVEKLRDAIGIPARLRDLGASAEQLPVWAAKSFEIKRLMWVNPRRATLDELVGILQAAY